MADEVDIVLAVYAKASETDTGSSKASEVSFCPSYVVVLADQ
jgi:hypothetical protein